jgi:hypothetical protein
MKSAMVRLALAAAAFVAWLGYLAFLALTTSRPIVLSRPQFLVSSLDVIAEVEEADGRPGPVVIVREVHFPADRTEFVDQPLTVRNLPGLTSAQGWTGPGLYILPLVAVGKDYEVAPLPPSPGFNAGQPRIYPLTPHTRGQLAQVPKPQ